MIRRFEPGLGLSEWLVSLARESLEHAAPRRWSHVDEAIRFAADVAPALGDEGDLLVAAVAGVGAEAPPCAATHCATRVPSSTPTAVEKAKCMPPRTRAKWVSSFSAPVVA